MTERGWKFKEGLRVRDICGRRGTVATVAGVRGKSIYCDPTRQMVFVAWDDGRAEGEFAFRLSRIVHEAPALSDTAARLWGTYNRLGLHISATPRALIRAARVRALAPMFWTDPDVRRQRHAFFRALLECHAHAAAIAREWRL